MPDDDELPGDDWTRDYELWLESQDEDFNERFEDARDGN